MSRLYESRKKILNNDTAYDIKEMHRAERNMQDKMNRFCRLLMIWIVTIFLLMGNANYIYTQEKSPETITYTQQHSEDDKLLPSVQIDFRLVGTIITGNENSYAIIEDKTTGRQDIYKSGTYIKNEAKVLMIEKDRIIVEKDGAKYILKVTEGNYTVQGPHTMGAEDRLPFFEPVFNETGPPVDET